MLTTTPRFNIGEYVIICNLSDVKNTVGKIIDVRSFYNCFQYDCEYFDCNDQKRVIYNLGKGQLRNCYSNELINDFLMKEYKAKSNTSYCLVNYTYASTIKLQPLKVKKVIFNGNRTIVIFDNGTKSIVKCEGERFDKEKGLAMALVKAMYGTNESHSNYYNIFKKWIPEDEEVLPADEIAYCERDAEVVKDLVENVAKNEINNPCNGCEESKDGCFTNCEKLQKASDAISNNEEINKPKPIEPGYFIKHNEERKEKSKYVASKTVKEQCEDFVNSHPNDIHAFVSRFSAAYFPSDFLKFCRDNNLYFYITDRIKGMKPIDPFTVTWQEVTGYLKRGLMVSCKKTKNNKAYLAVVMADNLFSMLPIELRKENRNE